MRLGLLHSLIRKDEKYLIREINSRKNIELVMIDDRNLIFHLGKEIFHLDAVLERCINPSRALHALKLFESAGIKCVNESKVAFICADKLLMSEALFQNNVPQPEIRIAFTETSALHAIEEMGYPVMLKPAVGSWGQLLSKVNDRDAAESILEHKTVLGTYHHSIFYIQEYIGKKGRDIRSFVIGDDCVTAVYRTGDHGITAVGSDGISEHCVVTDELREISLKAAHAVGGKLVAVDLLEAERGLLVTGVNCTIEFNDIVQTAGVNLPGLAVDYVMKMAEA